MCLSRYRVGECVSNQIIDTDETSVRNAVRLAQTIVVKVGSSSLTIPSGHLDVVRLNALVNAISHARMSGARIVLVSSGAIAAGFSYLGFATRPHDVPTQQATACVGQGLLMAHYEAAFARFGFRVGQLLLTPDVTISASRYRNAQRTLQRLLDLDVIPIVNENDSLASSEIRFGDNDRLSALVANIVCADALVLLTDVDALYTAPPSQRGAQRISFVADIEQLLNTINVAGSTSGVGTGGMITKIEAAHVAAVSGIPTVLAAASSAGPALMGDAVGTVFAPIHTRTSSKRLWIGFAAHPRGTLIIDDGAVCAIRGGRASLLAAGVVRVEGNFSAGDPVWVDSMQETHVAKGLVAFDSEDIADLMGQTTQSLQRHGDRSFAHPVIHRDNLVLQ